MTKIRIKDIAKMANVSTGTVDRVIHDRPGVSDETRKRIQELIEEYDYQPDILAGMLANNRAVTFLVCMPDIVSAHDFWRFPELGVERALQEYCHFDLHVEYMRFDQHNQKDFIDKSMAVNPSDYDGLLFAPVFSEASLSFINNWKDNNKPVFLFNSLLEDAQFDGFIGQDAFQSGKLGAKLMSYGLVSGRDLLVVNLSLRTDNYSHIIKRERGFRSFFETHTDRINNLVTIDINGGSYNEVSDLLKEKMSEYDVAGIFVTNSRVHLVAKYLEEQGMMSVRLIGYDLISRSVDYLKREYIDFLISQSPEEQAYLGLKNLFNLVAMKGENERIIDLPIDILTKENIGYYGMNQ